MKDDAKRDEPVEDPIQKNLEELVANLLEERGSPDTSVALLAFLVEAVGESRRQNETIEARLEYLRREIAKIKRHLGPPADEAGNTTGNSS